MSNEVNYETLRHKYLIEGENLNEHEMSFLFALLEDKQLKIKAIKKYAERVQYMVISHRKEMPKELFNYIDSKTDVILSLTKEG